MVIDPDPSEEVAIAGNEALAGVELDSGATFPSLAGSALIVDPAGVMEG